MMQRFEKIMEPIGPGDAQVNRSSMVDEIDVMLIDAMEEGRREHLGKRYNGYTYEIVPDGAGVRHYNLTVHFKSQQPALDPLNLNDAPQQMFGQVLDQEELDRRGVGRADSRWGMQGPTAEPVHEPFGEMGKTHASVPSAVDGKR